MLTLAIVALVVLVLAFVIPTVLDYMKVRAFGGLVKFLNGKKDVEGEGDDDDNRRKVCYHSNKHGWRNGRQVAPDNSGRIIIEMISRDGGTHTVRRQPHLVHEGWH